MRPAYRRTLRGSLTAANSAVIGRHRCVTHGGTCLAYLEVVRSLISKLLEKDILTEEDVAEIYRKAQVPPSEDRAADPEASAAVRALIERLQKRWSSNGLS